MHSEDLKEAHKMEQTVGQISRLLTEFVTILQTQRSSVDDVRCCILWLCVFHDMFLCFMVDDGAGC